ncbi:MAG: hypothetical protein CR994_04170 [Maribacter sp.]|nr:MAG: hypothetical protein CR994_04170 [Maribacter sp.]
MNNLDQRTRGIVFYLEPSLGKPPPLAIALQSNLRVILEKNRFPAQISPTITTWQPLGQSKKAKKNYSTSPISEVRVGTSLF